MNYHRTLALLALTGALSVACTKADTPAVIDDSGTVTDAAPSPSTETSSPAPEGDSPPRSTKWDVHPRGIGPLTAGMTLKQASAALDGALVIPEKLGECAHLQVAGAPELLVMVQKGTVSRVEIQSGTALMTAEGAKIGDTEDRIKSLYPGQVTVQPHKYTDGHYLVVTPTAAADSNYRIVFETDGKTVQRFRSGSQPAVHYVEGCS